CACTRGGSPRSAARCRTTTSRAAISVTLATPRSRAAAKFSSGSRAVEHAGRPRKGSPYIEFGTTWLRTRLLRCTKWPRRSVYGHERSDPRGCRRARVRQTGRRPPLLRRRIRREQDRHAPGLGHEARMGEPAHLDLSRCEGRPRRRAGVAVRGRSAEHADAQRLEPELAEDG